MALVQPSLYDNNIVGKTTTTTTTQEEEDIMMTQLSQEWQTNSSEMSDSIFTEFSVSSASSSSSPPPQPPFSSLLLQHSTTQHFFLLSDGTTSSNTFFPASHVVHPPQPPPTQPPQQPPAPAPAPAPAPPAPAPSPQQHQQQQNAIVPAYTRPSWDWRLSLLSELKNCVLVLESSSSADNNLDSLSERREANEMDRLEKLHDMIHDVLSSVYKKKQDTPNATSQSKSSNSNSNNKGNKKRKLNDAADDAAARDTSIINTKQQQTTQQPLASSLLKENEEHPPCSPPTPFEESIKPKIKPRKNSKLSSYQTAAVTTITNKNNNNNNNTNTTTTTATTTAASVTTTNNAKRMKKGGMKPVPVMSMSLNSSTNAPLFYHFGQEIPSPSLTPCIVYLLQLPLFIDKQKEPKAGMFVLNWVEIDAKSSMLLRMQIENLKCPQIYTSLTTASKYIDSSSSNSKESIKVNGWQRMYYESRDGKATNIGHLFECVQHSTTTVVASGIASSSSSSKTSTTTLTKKQTMVTNEKKEKKQGKSKYDRHFSISRLATLKENTLPPHWSLDPSLQTLKINNQTAWGYLEQSVVAALICMDDAKKDQQPLGIPSVVFRQHNTQQQITSHGHEQQPPNAIYAYDDDNMYSPILNITN